MTCQRMYHSLTLFLVMLVAVGGGLWATPCHGAGFTVTGSLSVARSGHTSTLLQNGKVVVVGGAVGSWGSLASAELYNPATGTFATTGNLITARHAHTATLLPNGKVLIVGGLGDNSNFTGNVPLASAELYDPATGTFTATGNLTTARYAHTSTLLPNGKVLISGGWNNYALTNVELYDPALGTFTAVGNLTTARFDHTATLLANGMVLFAGGHTSSGDYVASAELYDPTTKTFSTTGNLVTPRALQTATLLTNGKVLLVGGYNNNSLASAELYDPATGLFSASGTLISGCYMHTSTLLPNGKVLIAGGTQGWGLRLQTEQYDSTTGTFSITENMSTLRNGHTATLLANGAVLVVGGGNGSLLASAELYDSTIGSFTATGSMATARMAHTETMLLNGKVLLTGGFDSGSTAELYDPKTEMFSATKSLATARGFHTATLLPNGKVLIVGGWSGSSNSLSSVELYDPTNETFNTTGSLATARRQNSATLLPNGKVLIAGGVDSNGKLLASIELYDPATGAFTLNKGMITARAYHTATLLTNGKVLMTGGIDSSGYPIPLSEIYDPATGTFASTGSLITARHTHTAILLPNGKVLISGGGGYYSLQSSSELYDPATGTFSSTASMSQARVSSTMTLLSNGKVLVTGGIGSNNTSLASAELYDPATGMYALNNDLTTARAYHTATLLPNGNVLIAGGAGSGSYLNDSELYYQGLGFSDARRPVVSFMAFNGTKLVVTGTGFKGDSEASGGTTNNSATNYPLLQLQRVDNDQSAFILSDPATNWSATSFNSASVYGLPMGTYRATVYANAIPSLERLITIAPAISLQQIFPQIIVAIYPTPFFFDITNDGAADLIINDITINPNFTVSLGSCGPLPKTLAPGTSCTVTSTLSATTSGIYTGILSVTSNDPALPVVTRTFTAQYAEPTYPLTVSLSGPGTVSGTTNGTPSTLSFPTSGSASIFQGATVTLTPTPTAISNSGTVFKGWSGGCSGMGDTANKNACTVTMTAPVTVAASFGPAPIITTANPLPTGTVNVAYNKALAATGGTAPYTWSLVSGSTLPTGMTMSAAGVLGGTPTVTGNFSFSVQVKDATLAAGTVTFNLNSTTAPLVISTTALVDTTTGANYGKTLTATGGVKPYTWSIASGALPPGISLNTATGFLSGATTTGGTYSFTVMVKDSQSPSVTATKAYIITVSVPPLTITTAGLPAGTVGAAYPAAVLAATGGIKPYNWSIAAGKLPPGVGLTSNSGTISGTPTVAGTFAFTLKLEDCAGTPPVSRDYTIRRTA